MLIVIRGVLGVRAALVMPATLSTITSTFPREQKARAVGIWAGVAGASAVMGLLVAGVLLPVWSWRAVFGLNIVLAAAAVVGTLRVVPESADPDTPRVDVAGAALAVLGLGALVFSVIEAPTAGWLSSRTLVGLAVGLVVLAVFVGWQLRTARPLLDPRLFRLPAFAAGTLSITLQFFAFFGFIFLVLQYLQLVRGDSPLVAALSLIPMAAAMMPAARLAPRAAARVGARRVCVLGLALLTSALVVLAQLDPGSSYWLLLGGLVPLGAGMGLAMTPATTAITDALPAAKQGVGSAINDLSRELGGALAIAVLGSALSALYRGHLDLTGLPESVAESARSSLALATRLGTPVADQARQAFVDGMTAALLCAAAVVAAAAVAVAVLLRAHPRAAGPHAVLRDGFQHSGSQARKRASPAATSAKTSSSASAASVSHRRQPARVGTHTRGPPDTQAQSAGPRRQCLQYSVRPPQRVRGVGVGRADLRVEVEVHEQLGRPLLGHPTEVIADLVYRAGEGRRVAAGRGAHRHHAPYDEAERRGVPPGRRGGVTDHRNRGAEGAQVGPAAADPAVRQPPGSPQRRLGGPAEQQRRVRALHRLRVYPGAGHLVELAVEVDDLVGPHAAQAPGELLHPGSAPLKANAGRGVLLPGPTQPEPGVQPALGHLVEGGQLLGEHHR